MDLVNESFDVAIRMGEPKESNLVPRLLAQLPGQLYASPGYLEQAGSWRTRPNWQAINASVSRGAVAGN